MFFWREEKNDGRITKHGVKICVEEVSVLLNCHISFFKVACEEVEW